MSIFTRINLKKIVLSASVALCIAGSAQAAEWTKLSGSNPYIHSIYFPYADPGKVVLCSDLDGLDIAADVPEPAMVGMGATISIDSGKTFNQLILSGFPVYDVLKFKKDPNHWVAAVRKYYRGGLLHSKDGGAKWDSVLSCDSPAQIVKLASSVVGDKEYFASVAIGTTSSFLSSDDGFSTGNTNNGLSVQSRDVAYSKAEPKLLFIAGDQASYGRVMRSRDNGISWSKEVSGLEGLRVFTVHPSWKNPAIVFCGADSLTTQKSAIGKGIYMSQDTGRTWKLVGAAGAQVFSITEHPTDGNYMAAACGEKGVYISANGGLSWEPHNEGLSTKSIRNIAIPEWGIENKSFVVFAGAFGDGLYKSSFLAVGVDDVKAVSNELAISRIYPQPAKNTATILWNNPENQSVDINVYDNVGNKVFSLANTYFQSGENVFEWNCENLNPGVYFINFNSGKNSFTSRISVIK